jgi:hypothetical protein
MRETALPFEELDGVAISAGQAVKVTYANIKMLMDDGLAF